MKSVIVIKLGGSVITNKKTTGLLRSKIIASLGKEIRQLAQSGHRLVLIHGAGGNIHKLAKQYGLQNGVNTQQQLAGALKVQYELLSLQNKVAEVLQKQSLPVFPLQTTSSFELHNENLKLLNRQVIDKILENGGVPLLTGSMVLNNRSNWSILSGDTICLFFAELYKAKQLYFLTDVNGFLTQNSRSKKLATIPKLSMVELDNHITAYSSYKPKDATGDMIGKLRAILQKPKTLEVIIRNGLKPNKIFQRTDGTIIK